MNSQTQSRHTLAAPDTGPICEVLATHEPNKDDPPLPSPLLPPREEREKATVQGPNARPELEVEALHEPAFALWATARQACSNWSLVIGPLEGTLAKYRLPQSPITSYQLPVTSYKPLSAGSRLSPWWRLLCRKLVSLVAVAFLTCLTGSAGAASARSGESEMFFSTGAVPRLRIQIAATNVAKLRSNPRGYVTATVSEGTNVYRQVGVHLKGAAGSFRPINDAKPALTLNFDRFLEHQRFHGIDKLALNNSVQDSSYMTEALCSELFLAAGVPTPRTTHARVQLNGRDLGFYVLKEGFDKTFLRRHFKNVNGNLYDGGFLNEITGPLERTSGDGDVPNHADLKALAAAAQEPNHAQRLARLEKVLDVERFLTFVALEMLTWHWDGYTLKRNNYRVYHDPDADKMIFFPHGMDQMFWEPNGPVIPARTQIEGLVARALLETTEGQRRYRGRVASLLTNVFTLERLTNHLQQLRARIRPQLEAIDPDAAREHDRSATHLFNAVVQRVQRARQILTEPEPEPIRFDSTGLASLAKWQSLDIRGTGRLDKAVDAGGLETLHIAAGQEGRCTASWRTLVILNAGHYVFEARVRTRGVVTLQKDVATKGVGAGIRESRKQPRKQGFTGDNEWQKTEYEFTVPNEAEEVTLLCELRAEKGEAWFDLASLKLRATAQSPASGVQGPKFKVQSPESAAGVAK